MDVKGGVLAISFAAGIVFLFLELLFIALTLLAILRFALGQLDTSAAIARDGLRLGAIAPRWSLPDMDGHIRSTPNGARWQLLAFTDHSLAAFPGVAAGMNQLAEESPDLEILIASRENRQLNEITARVFELRVPIMPVDQRFYDSFRVRVMPFAFVLDPSGVVRWLGLVNTDAQLRHMWRMAQTFEEAHGVLKEATA